MPASVVSSTIKAASLFAAGQAAAAGVISVQVAALTEGVLKAMLLTKLKIVAAVLLALAVFGAGAVALAQPRAGRQIGRPGGEANPGAGGETGGPAGEAEAGSRPSSQ